jgi:hypothetical protein
MKTSTLLCLLLAGCSDGAGICARGAWGGSNAGGPPEHSVTLHYPDGSPICRSARVTAVFGGRALPILRGPDSWYLRSDGTVLRRSNDSSTGTDCANGYGNIGDVPVCGNTEMQVRIEVEGCAPITRTIRWSEVEAVYPMPTGWRAGIRINCQ